MSIVKFFKSLVATPQFLHGDRVNHLPRGAMARTDGYVLAQDSRGVLVEWPRDGTKLIAASELCRIG